MTAAADALLARAERLRSNFDRGFAEPPAAVSPPQLDLLAIRCADQELMMPLAQVLAVYTERKLVSVPSPAPELLGLVGVRGVVAPVYDLRALLGFPAGDAPRWLALVRASKPFAVGFELFERHVRLPASDVLLVSADAAGTAGTAHPFARGTVRTAAGPRPLIDLQALFAAVTGRRRAAPEREDLG